MAVQKRVKVLRAFRHGGEDIGTDSVLDLDIGFAQELVTARKVELVDPQTKLVSVAVKPKEQPAEQENAQIAALSKQVAQLMAALTKSAGKKETANV